MRRRNFEIAKQAELIPQHKKFIFKKQLYHIDQHKNWTSMMFCGIFKKLRCTPLMAAECSDPYTSAMLSILGERERVHNHS